MEDCYHLFSSHDVYVTKSTFGCHFSYFMVDKVELNDPQSAHCYVSLLRTCTCTHLYLSALQNTANNGIAESIYLTVCLLLS